MKKEEVNVAPDGSHVLNSYEVERQTRRCLAAMPVVGAASTVIALRQLAKQVVWDNCMLLRVVVQTILAEVYASPDSTSELADVCHHLVWDRGIDGMSARQLLVLACQNSYDAYWQQVSFAAAEKQRPGLEIPPGVTLYRLGPCGRELMQFYGYLFCLDILPKRFVIHVVLEHVRHVRELPEERLHDFACLLEICGPKLAVADQNRAVLAQMLEIMQMAVATPLISFKRKQLLRLLVLMCYSWEPAIAGASSVREMAHNALATEDTSKVQS